MSAKLHSQEQKGNMRLSLPFFFFFFERGAFVSSHLRLAVGSSGLCEYKVIVSLFEKYAYAGSHVAKCVC